MIAKNMNYITHNYNTSFCVGLYSRERVDALPDMTRTFVYAFFSFWLCKTTTTTPPPKKKNNNKKNKKTKKTKKTKRKMHTTQSVATRTLPNCERPACCRSPRGLTFTGWGCSRLCQRHELLTAFRSINSLYNSPLSHSLLPVLILRYWSLQLYISLWKSPSALGWLGLKHQLTNCCKNNNQNPACLYSAVLQHGKPHQASQSPSLVFQHPSCNHCHNWLHHKLPLKLSV